MIGSGHTALAHNSKILGTFSNSGNYQETQQSCGNSCTLSSSNVITQGQGGASTTPSPIPPAGTDLALVVRNVTNGLSLRAFLAFSASNQLVTAPVGGLTITFTGTGVPPNLAAMVQEGNLAIYSVTIKPPTTPGTYTVQAHFAGATLQLQGGQTVQILGSDSRIAMFTVP